MDWYDIKSLYCFILVSKATFGFVKERCETLFGLLYNNLFGYGEIEGIRYINSKAEHLSPWYLPTLIDHITKEPKYFNRESTCFLLRVIYEIANYKTAVNRARPPRMSDCISRVYFIDEMNHSVSNLMEHSGIMCYDLPENMEELRDNLTEIEICALDFTYPESYQKAIQYMVYEKYVTKRYLNSLNWYDILSHVVINEKHFWSKENNQLRKTVFCSQELRKEDVFLSILAEITFINMRLKRVCEVTMAGICCCDIDDYFSDTSSCMSSTDSSED
jgi:hypothetical protein